MITFFRKIRFEFVNKNQTVKYLKYAIGEIILVVIGILIALAINNNNIHRIIKQKEKTYLIGLEEEFQTSKLKLIELTEVNMRSFNGAKQIVGFISNKNEPPAEAEFSELLFNTFSPDISFNPNNSLLNEMINSGSLKDIANTKLRIQLTNWVSTMEDISKQEDELRIQREKVLDMFRLNEYSLKTIFDQTGVSQELGLPITENYRSNLNLLNSMEFENNILMFILTSYATGNTHYNPLMDDLNIILELLNNEIEK
ncbi:MAG TPA: hypothetical protein VIN10_01820 [Bacteroidales bacterium]